MKKFVQIFKKINQWAQIPRSYYGYLATISLASAIVFLSHLTANVLITEMIISFLALATILQTVAIIIAFIWTILFFRKGFRVRIVGGVLLILIVFGWGFNLMRIWDYAYPQYLYSATWDKELNPKDTNVTIKIGFFNKSYFNSDTQAVSDQVRLLALDVLGIAEISQQDYNTLKTQLPFSNSYFTTCQCQSDQGSEVAIFSHYPLSNIQTNFIEKMPILQTDITVSNKVLNLVVTHPYSPISASDLHQRNFSLNALVEHLKIYDSRQLVLMGDFNTSSWSWTYRDFLAKQPWLRDANRGHGLTSTWNTTIFHTMIDHLFLSESISLQSFTILPEKLGSDHHLIWAEIQL